MRQLVISKSITHREYKSLDRYFNEIDKIGLISSKEEALLMQKIREGDQQALQRLTNTNLRFVVSVAKQYQNRGLTLGDLINEGNIGLIKAAKRFDETKGFKFISFAVWWIRQSILAAITDQIRIVHLPFGQVALLNKLSTLSSQLEQQHGRKPSVDELAESLGISAGKVSGLIGQSGMNVSIDAPFGCDTENSLLDVLHDCVPGPDASVISESIKEEIAYSLKILSDRDHEIIMLYFGLGLNSPIALEEIAQRFNLSVEHTRRLKDNALTKLRTCSNAPVLRSCLVD